MKDKSLKFFYREASTLHINVLQTYGLTEPPVALKRLIASSSTKKIILSLKSYESFVKRYCFDSELVILILKEILNYSTIKSFICHNLYVNADNSKLRELILNLYKKPFLYDISFFGSTIHLYPTEVEDYHNLALADQNRAVLNLLEIRLVETESPGVNEAEFISKSFFANLFKASPSLKILCSTQNLTIPTDAIDHLIVRLMALPQLEVIDLQLNSRFNSDKSNRLLAGIAKLIETGRFHCIGLGVIKPNDRSQEEHLANLMLKYNTLVRLRHRAFPHLDLANKLIIKQLCRRQLQSNLLITNKLLLDRDEHRNLFFSRFPRELLKQIYSYLNCHPLNNEIRIERNYYHLFLVLQKFIEAHKQEDLYREIDTLQKLASNILSTLTWEDAVNSLLEKIRNLYYRNNCVTDKQPKLDPFAIQLEAMLKSIIFSNDSSALQQEYNDHKKEMRTSDRLDFVYLIKRLEHIHIDNIEALTDEVAPPESNPPLLPPCRMM